MSVRIVVLEGEPISKALRRLKNKLQASGAAWEARRRRYPKDATQERRTKRFQKRFKTRRATLLAQSVGEQPVASMAEAIKRFWERSGKP
jgi:ribosomal protein S21